jgi:hypothetical protein
MRQVTLELPDALAESLEKNARRAGFETPAALIVDHLKSFSWVFDEPESSDVEVWLQTTVKNRVSRMDQGTASAIPLRQAFDAILSRPGKVEEQSHR